MTTPALRRTIRRCVALLLLQLGAISGQIATIEFGPEPFVAVVTLPLSLGSVVYLVGSLLYSLFSRGEGE